MAERREEDPRAPGSPGSPRPREEAFLVNAASHSPGTWVEDGEACEIEMDTEVDWHQADCRESSPKALDFSITNSAKAERRLELSVTVNKSGFDASDTFGGRSETFDNKEQTLLDREESVSDEEENDCVSSSELAAVPLGEENYNFDPIDDPQAQNSEPKQTAALNDDIEEENGIEQDMFKGTEEMEGNSEDNRLKCTKNAAGSKAAVSVPRRAADTKKSFLTENYCDEDIGYEDENQAADGTTRISNLDEAEDGSSFRKSELFDDVAQNGDNWGQVGAPAVLGEDLKSPIISRKGDHLKDSVNWADKKDVVSESGSLFEGNLTRVVASLSGKTVEEGRGSPRADGLHQKKSEKNQKVDDHEDTSIDETSDVDIIEQEATVIAETASPGAVVGKKSDLHRNSESVKSMSTMKIKEEPLDEEYEKALAPQSSLKVKDEPNSLQHPKPNDSDIRISAVFSVSSSPLATQLVQQSTPSAPSTDTPTGGNATPSAPPMTVRVTCSGCKKILQKGQTAYQRKGSTQLFCSTGCLTGFSTSTSTRPPSTTRKFCYQCSNAILNSKEMVMGQVDGRRPYQEFCNQTCLFEMKRKSASTTNNITTKCSICQKVSVVRHEVNYQNVVHKLCSDTCFSKFRMSNNLTMNCCDNCGAYCYSGSAQCHVLQSEGRCKKFCSSSCLSTFKQKMVKITPCTWCKSLRSSLEMIENTNSFGKIELFCSVHCLSAYRVQMVTTQGTSVQCHYCKVTTTPQYHLAMSDGSIRNFCTYNCVASFQGLFNQAAQGSQTVVPLSLGQVTVNIPPGTSVVTGSPVITTTSVTSSAAAGLQRLAQSQKATVPRPVVRLKCQYCQRVLSLKPELLEYKSKMVPFCGKTCCDEYKRINSVVAVCEYCRSEKIVKETLKFSGVDRSFCSEGCKLLYKHDLAKRWGPHCKSCSSCSQSSRRLLTQQFGGKKEEFCSEECLSKFAVLFYQMAKCDCCKRQGMLSDSIKWHGETKNFCNLNCVLTFCNQQSLTESASPDEKVTVSNIASGQRKEAAPVIANIISLTSTPPIQNAASSTTAVNAGGTRITSGTQDCVETSTQTETARPKTSVPPKVLKNKALLCKPITQTKATSCKPHTQTKSCQTEEEWKPKLIVVPIPVPIYIPVPLNLYTQLLPFPLGMPVPLPVPIFIPTTLDSADRIIETIQDIKEKIPSNPFEADLLTMAAMIAEEEEKDKTLSHGDQGSTYSGDLESEAVSTPHSWEDELTNFTLKHSLASAPEPEIKLLPAPEVEVDLEADITIDTYESSRHNQIVVARQNRAKQRAKNNAGLSQPRKRGRKKSIVGLTRDFLPEPVAEKSHVGLFLKYMYGVNAWKRWVQRKNSQGNHSEELRFGSRLVKLKEDILSCTAAELSFGLCQFIQDVRRPNGEKYHLDSIFYLCLGIQQYIFENSRIDNIFTDIYYMKFTAELTKALKMWEPQLLPSGQLFCRIEEEHLWECKQLGAYSPTVLLNTLLFFNTKYFQVKSVSEHMNLSFTHIMRCTKSLKHNTKLTYLRFIRPTYKKDKDTGKLQFGKRKRSDEEEEEDIGMSENTDNPVRCPVRLFEFYLSKCSESVRARSDIFYLQPERSCVPDSPMWYSPLPTDHAILDAMLTRILMVREVHEELAKVAHGAAAEEDISE